MVAVPLVSSSSQARILRLQGIQQGQVLVGPQTVHIDIANGCNTNCVTCWDHSPLLDQPRPAAWKRQLMTLETFTDLVEDLATMGSVEAVILSGMGDPFVNPHIYRMIELCKDQGCQVTVLTNALLADPERLLALDLDMMLISVNGVTPQSYLAFHPNLHQRDFEHLCHVLATFAQAGKRFKHVQVINQNTYLELADMVCFAQRYQAHQITYKLASLGGGTERCGLDPEHRQWLLNSGIPAARTQAATLGISTNLDVLAQQLQVGGLATAPIAETGCFMGWLYARVTVDGTLLYCCAREVVVGSLAVGPFSEQWYGMRWHQVRERLMQGSYFASCQQCGKFNQNVKWADKVKHHLGEALYLARTGRSLQVSPSAVTKDPVRAEQP